MILTTYKARYEALLRFPIYMVGFDLRLINAL